MKKLLYGVVAAVIVIAIILVLQLFRSTLTEKASIFRSKEACEETSDSECTYQQCDYIPNALRVDEVCGKHFKKGWVPAN